MKKSSILVMLLALAVMLSAIPFASFAADNDPGAVFDFYYEKNATTGAFKNITGCKLGWESDGFLRITSDEDILEKDEGIGDVNFYLVDAEYCELDCDEYPYFAVNLRNPSTATQFEAHFGTDVYPLSASNVFHADIEAGMDGFKTFVSHIPSSNVTWVNLLNAPGGLTEQETGSATAEELAEDDYTWSGILTGFRVDGLYFGGRSGLDQGGNVLDIAWIAFFKTEEAARNFQGPDHTVVPADETEAPVDDDPLPFGTLIFDTDDYDDFWGNLNGVDDVFFNEEEKCYEFALSDSNDPFAAMQFDSYVEYGVIDDIDLDVYKVMQLKVKIDPSAGSSGNIYFTTDDAPGAYAEAKNVAFQYEKTDEWQIVNIDFSRQRTWTDYLSVTRFDMFSSVHTETSVKIAYVTFFKTMSAATAFAEGGSQFPATPEPTATPEATPTPEATATPEATEASGATAAPEATAEPKPGNGCKTFIGSASVVIISLAAVAVFLKKH
ncbi:MAG: hypothetical protein ILO53_01970 [Clostridia bacterium]|nr:hypothetical protein [Clostridia bacterium]